MFYKDEPVLYFDSLKTSTLEGAATTVYAQGWFSAPLISNDKMKITLIAGTPCKNPHKEISS